MKTDLQQVMRTMTKKKISEVSVFLLEDGKVIGILIPQNMNQVSSNSDGSITLKDLKFVTKYKTNRTLEAHVVIMVINF